MSVGAPLSADPAVPPPASGVGGQRFTIDGSDELEAQLESACARIRSGVRGLIPAVRLEGIVLGGGYGRGEGGVLRQADGDHPYNDLDFYVLIRGSRQLNERRHRESLETFGEIVASLIGVEVELKISSLAELGRAPVSMFTYDLMARHRWLWGDEGRLDRGERHREVGAIPVSEATRLLLNRGSGLLLARERLERPGFGPAEADFVRRNIAKAELAWGDAVLTARGLYHWSCPVRHRRLEQLASAEPSACLDNIIAAHARGVTFKLHPVRSEESREELAAALAAASQCGLGVWLHLEERRLGGHYASVREYARCPLNKCSCSPRWRNLLVNFRLLGFCPLRQRRPGIHPRDRALRALALLLWDPEALSSPDLRRRIRAELNTRASDFPGLVRAYQDLWSKVS